MTISSIYQYYTHQKLPSPVGRRLFPLPLLPQPPSSQNRVVDFKITLSEKNSADFFNLFWKLFLFLVQLL